MSLVYSFAFIGLMSAYAETISWFIIILIQIFLLAVSGGCYYTRMQNEENFAYDDGLNDDQKFAFKEDFESRQD